MTGRYIFFGVLIGTAVLLAATFAVEYARKHPRRLPAFCRRFLALLLMFAGMSLVGQLSFVLCKRLFPPPFARMLATPMFAPAIPIGLPAVSLTTLLCGIVVLFQYRKQERLKEKLQDSERSRTDLLKDLAHDVRSPLTALGLVLEGLKSPKKVVERANLAMKELEYLQRLVDSQLLLAQQAEGARVDIVDLLMEIVGQFEDLWDDIKWRVDLTTDKEEVVLNRLLLDRALRNVFQNAAQHAKSNVFVTLNIVDKTTLELIVRDDGPGFTPKTLETFGKRASVSIADPSRPVTQSMGLGSHILYASIEQMLGSVRAANWEHGAEVRIRLPR